MRKIAFFFEIAKTIINVRSGALQGKRQAVQNRVFRPLEAPWSPPEAEPFFQDPPGAPQSLLWSSRGRPEPSQERPGAPKGHIKFTKLTCSKPWKYVYLTLWDLKKSVPDHFFTLLGPTRDPPESSPFPSRSPLGTQKGPPERSRTPDGPPGAPFWPVF